MTTWVYHGIYIGVHIVKSIFGYFFIFLLNILKKNPFFIFSLLLMHTDCFSMEKTIMYITLLRYYVHKEFNVLVQLKVELATCVLIVMISKLLGWAKVVYSVCLGLISSNWIYLARSVRLITWLLKVKRKCDFLDKWE